MCAMPDLWMERSRSMPEARCVYSITTRHAVPTPEDVGVENVNYLAGLGDVSGELRRHILDLIRSGRAQRASISWV